MADATDDIETPPCPFPAGTRVRLARPENPDHPRRGRVGTVGAARWFPPAPRRAAGSWQFRVVFRVATWADWQTRREIDDIWHCRERELEPSPR